MFWVLLKNSNFSLFNVFYVPSQVKLYYDPSLSLCYMTNIYWFASCSQWTYNLDAGEKKFQQKAKYLLNLPGTEFKKYLRVREYKRKIEL